MSDPAACDIGCDEYGYPVPAMARARDAEMVERVARVLCSRCGVDPSDMNGGLYDGGSYARGKPAWASWADDARAVIAAMREPTDEMAEEGFEHTSDPCWPEDVKAAYRAMIDTALGVRS